MFDAIQTVLFDLDGTLVFHKPESFEVIRSFCTEIGQPLDPQAERSGRRMRYQYFASPAIREQINGLSGDRFWQHYNWHLLQALGIRGDLDHLAEAVSARFADVEFVYDCPPAGRRTLHELRSRGYTLGLITNRGNVERFHRLLDELDLWPYFDLVLASGEIGVGKPEPGIFDIALERLGTTADRAVYIGDNYWADAVGARGAGITPILFDPHRLLPEADCPVLERIEDLLRWLA